MSEELNVAVEPVETTTAPEPITSTPEVVEEKFPEFKETSDKSVLRQQLEHAAKSDAEKKRGNPYKSADGKFTKKPLEPKEAPETAAAAPLESELKIEATTAPQAVSMPKSWSADKQALWDQAPQALKDFILSRENQVNEGFAKYQGIEPKYKALDAVLAPLDPMIQGYGTTREAFVQQLAGWHQALANNPNEAFPALARAYGFNLTGSPAADPAQNPNVVYDPRVDTVSQTLAQMQQRLAETERREAEAQMRSTSEQVAKWATVKPHYDKVRQDMGLRIKAAAEIGREMSLDEAYEASIWANPEIRDQLMKSQFEAQQKKAQEEAKKAKLASVSATSRAPSGPTNGTGKPNDLRSEITKNLRDYQGAGRA
jgi:hypothetical protein